MSEAVRDFGPPYCRGEKLSHPGEPCRYPKRTGPVWIAPCLTFRAYVLRVPGLRVAFSGWQP